MKKILGVLVIALSVVLTGCITIDESYTFNADGSGSMKYTIDMSALIEMMESMDEGGDHEGELEAGPDALGSAGDMFAEKLDELKSISGITNVQSSGTSEEYIYTLSFDFTDVDALNTALNHVLGRDEDGKEFKFFTAKGKKVARASILGDLAKEFSEGEDLDREMMSMLWDNVNYRVSYQFANEIKSSKAEKTGTLSADKKAYSTEFSLSELVNNPEIMKVSFKTR